MRKTNTIACFFVCMASLFMLASCQSSKKVNEEDFAETAHMRVEGSEYGLKITLNGVKDADINVFDGNEKLPVYLETENYNHEYLFRFTEAGKEYRVQLGGKDLETDEWFEESAYCTALGGHKFEDCIDLTKFHETKVVGTLEDGMHKARVQSTDIKSINSIVKSDFIDFLEFEFVLVLGDNDTIGKEEWWSGMSFNTNDNFGKSKGLRSYLQSYKNIRLNNWHSSQDNFGKITDEKYEEFDYTYKYYLRIKIHPYSQNGFYSEHYVTEPIQSVPYAYPPDVTENGNVLVLARPYLTPLQGASYEINDDLNRNFIKINKFQYSSGGCFPLAEIKYGDGTTTFKDWDKFDTMSITLQGDTHHEIKIYAENTLTDERKELTSYTMYEFVHQTATVSISDIKDFFPADLADEYKIISICTDGESTYKFTSLKFEKNRNIYSQN